MPPGGSHHEVNGVRLFCEERGEGIPLVLLHSGFADRRMWDREMETLSRGHRVVRYDRRGFGRSDPFPGPFSDAQDLDALLTDLGIPTAVLVASSRGATAALDLSVARPEKVAALILAGPVVEGCGVQGDPQEQRLTQLLELREMEIARAVQLEGVERATDLLLDLWGSRLSAPERARIRELVLENAPMALTGVRLTLPPDPPTFQRLERVRCPTELLVGEADDPLILHWARAMASRLPQGRATVIPDADHLVNLSQPAAFQERILSCLHGLRGALAC